MRWLALALAMLAGTAQAQVLQVGSKRFTESYVLGELLIRTSGSGTHRQGLGGTGIVFAALQAGAIDLYPEYTGTIAREILKLQGKVVLEDLNRRLAPMGLGAAVPLGFNNSYALAMREDRAQALAIRKVSDLARHPGLRLGLGQEFIGRADGWPGLKAAYALPHATPQGLDHGLAYEAIAAGKIDVMDIYTTDAKIERFGLRALEDDRGFFPRYDAVLLYRLDVPKRFPEAWAKLQTLEKRIDERAMIRMNAAAELQGRSFAEAAALLDSAASPAKPSRRSFVGVLFGPDLLRLTWQHLVLVFVSLAASIAAGVPLGILAAKLKWAEQPILGAVGVIQTIPALALFVFLIALMGVIGTVPALVALFLYALLPIVRGTQTGLATVGKGMRQAAMALGLPAAERMRRVELPLALPSILAGIKVSAVINVGTATIAAFVGAGGYGERIVSGLALNDNAMMLAGAVPAAALALAVQWGFERGERRWGWRARADVTDRLH
jgi:osmoprotectant transport system permease protein